MSRFLSVLLALALGVCAQAAPVDPTRPPRELAPAAATAQPRTPLKLQAILRAPGGARAVINGQSLAVGERLGDARVLAIHSRSVLIEQQGQRDWLRLAAPILTPSRTP